MVNMNMMYVPCGLIVFSGLLSHCALTIFLPIGKIYYACVIVINILLSPVYLVYAPYMIYGLCLAQLGIVHDNSYVCCYLVFIAIFIIVVYAFFAVVLVLQYYGLGIVWHICCRSHTIWEVMVNLKVVLLIQATIGCFPCAVLEVIASDMYPEIISYDLLIIPCINMIAFAATWAVFLLDYKYADHSSKARFMLTMNGFLYLYRNNQIQWGN